MDKAKNKYRREYAWINSKLSQGVSREKLLNCVGAFSNKKKDRVMREKGLSEKEYRKRYDFLSRVYSILS